MIVTGQETTFVMNSLGEANRIRKEVRKMMPLPWSHKAAHPLDAYK